jgi:ornithine cyclodeaminase/alanine dehydrogenase-like protein (mu-crystallin family)
MVRLLSNADAERVLDMASVVRELERLYDDLGRGSAVYRGRTDLLTPTVAPLAADVPSAHQFKTLDGAIPRLRAASIRVTSDVVAFPTVGGALRRIKVPAAEGDRYVGLVFLFSTATGEPLAILQDGVLQRLAVGAVNAIAAKYLARRDATSVGLIGAGAQARSQILALAEVRALANVAVYDPSEEAAKAFCSEMATRLGIPVEAAASAEDAVRGADIAVTATNSRVPFFPAAWLAPGMHLSCMQRDEAQDDCFAAADVVVFHTPAKELEYVSSDFAEMERRHGFTMHDHPPRDLDWTAFPDLGALVAGTVPGRRSEKQRTLFLNSTGIGAVYTAVGHLVYERCAERGLGHEIPADWFLEAVH